MDLAGWDLSKPSGVMCRCAYAVGLLLMATALVLWTQKSTLPALSVPLALGVAAALWAVGRVARRLDWRAVLAGTAVLCFALRLFWVLWAPIEPAGDYEVFYTFALRLVREHTMGGMYTRYIALFPHIFGYSWFLSLFYTLLPPTPLTAALLNVVLSTLSCVLLFLLARKLAGPEAAAGCALLWALFPSQIIYNMFVLSEPLYTTLILAALLAVATLEGKTAVYGPGPCLGLGALAGLLLALVNLCRPVAVILVLSLVLWLGLTRLERWRERGFRRSWLCFLLALALVYFAGGRLGSAYVEYRLGEETASTPGYNILVGFNPRSEGTWNQEDSDLLYAIDGQPGSTAASTQAQMMDAAKARLTSGEVDFRSLFTSKLRTFLCGDSVCVDYAATVVRHREALSLLCDLAWAALLLLATLGTGHALWKKDTGPLFPAALYFIGLTLAHGLVEVAPRYHYSLLIPLILLAVRGAAALAEGCGGLASRLAGKGRTS